MADPNKLQQQKADEAGKRLDALMGDLGRKARKELKPDPQTPSGMTECFLQVELLKQAVAAEIGAIHALLELQGLGGELSVRSGLRLIEEGEQAQ